MLYAYGDESADETKQRVFAVGAVIGAEHQWQALEEKWHRRTAGVPFHAKDCDSDKGDFATSTHTENKKLYADLIGLLAESGMGGWAVVIDFASQREVFPEAMDMSYYKGLSEIVEHMKNCAHFNGETVSFTFDMREESAYNTEVLFSMLRSAPEWAPFISGDLKFECSRSNPRLQAADLFVREVMKAWDNRVGPVKRPMRKSWARLLETERFHGEVLGLDWFAGLKERLPDLERRLGMSMQQYATWLNDRNLDCDNMSNRLMYIKWSSEQDKAE